MYDRNSHEMSSIIDDGNVVIGMVFSGWLCFPGLCLCQSQVPWLGLSWCCLPHSATVCLEWRIWRWRVPPHTVQELIDPLIWVLMRRRSLRTPPANSSIAYSGIVRATRAIYNTETLYEFLGGNWIRVPLNRALNNLTSLDCLINLISSNWILYSLFLKFQFVFKIFFFI